MAGQTALMIVGVCTVLVTLGVLIAPRFFKSILKLSLRPLGEFQIWHRTVGHDSQPFPPEEYWIAAIAQLESEGAKLKREWYSHASTGDRVSREYELAQSTILLELDRWNGFTISSDPDQADSITERITARLEESQR